MKNADDKLRIEVVKAQDLRPEKRDAILALCNRAYGEDLEPLFRVYADPVHVVGYLDNAIVSHAMWVTRWLQSDNEHPLRTAYVEMVATEPQFQGRGFASKVMGQLANEIRDYELGALWPNDIEFYARLGWVLWRGPLFIRSSEGLRPMPEDRVMILNLPKTPPLDLDGPLSAEWREGELL